MSKDKDIGQRELELIVHSAKGLNEQEPDNVFSINSFTTGINFDDDKRVLTVKDYSNFIFELELSLLFSQQGKKTTKETLVLSNRKKLLLGLSAVTIESYKIPKNINRFDDNGSAIEVDWSSKENWDEGYVGRRENFIFDVLKRMLIHKPISIVDSSDNTELERSYFLTTSLREIQNECAKFGSKINRGNIKTSLFRLNKTTVTLHGVDNSNEFSTLIDKIYYREDASSVDKGLVIVFRGVIAKAIEGKKQFARFNLRKLHGDNSTLLEEWFKKECYIYDDRNLSVGDTVVFSFKHIIEDSGLLNFFSEKESQNNAQRKRKIIIALDQICENKASKKFLTLIKEWERSLYEIVGLDELIQLTIKTNTAVLIDAESIPSIKLAIEGIGSSVFKKYPNLSQDKKKTLKDKFETLFGYSVNYYSRIYFTDYQFRKQGGEHYVELIGAKKSLVDEIKKMKFAAKRFKELDAGNTNSRIR